MRTDTLKLFGWELFGQPVRVSQLLSVILVLAGFIVLIIGKKRHPHGKDALFVTKLALKKSLEEQAAAAMETAGDSSGNEKGGV